MQKDFHSLQTRHVPLLQKAVSSNENCELLFLSSGRIAQECLEVERHAGARETIARGMTQRRTHCNISSARTRRTCVRDWR